ncbi:hypothetical protein PPERSA_05495 [Pseudocohnilembus persalinus]|uniref:Uncharacterized protein n=1 Tax=Pseudocohnilembus persalinus TaxID=266149 RepID=A0A0V0QCQ1_PSEPJ|nr:hypothetical protein PPERSA_05495 [Pseudocohnilembus persalinus]|eukprot:KRW99992.1 hypothetical protein PPERSA_05495 [Pseudocohnilembus persalinus]
MTFPEQHKSPNPDIWTWNQRLNKFNPYQNNKLFDKQMKERSNQKKMFFVSENYQDMHVSQDQKIEKEIINKTDKLMKTIKQQNKLAPVDHKQKVNEIKKNKDLIDFIDFDQRKLQ